MKHLSTFLAAALGICSAASCCNAIPASSSENGIAVVAHRGYWKNELVQNAQNSIAALRVAQDYGFSGSEFDVHITADSVLVVNHDQTVNGIDIQRSTYADLAGITLSNGEKISTIDEYLSQGETAPATLLVFELKPQYSEERDILLVEKGIEALKKHNLFDPLKVAFISFSYTSCLKIAELAPEFTNQYLGGKITPAELHAAGINGLDYHYDQFYKHPEWVEEAHNLGMSVNVWTVDKESDIQAMIDLGVDYITTNHPVTVRRMLGRREIRIL